MLFILVAPAELSDENQDVEEDDKINIDKIKKILEATNEKWINDLVSKIWLLWVVKGTASLVSSDPPYSNARFTTVPMKPKPDQKCGRYPCLSDLRVYFCEFLNCIWK